jgi:hypothetical protein
MCTQSNVLAFKKSEVKLLQFFLLIKVFWHKFTQSLGKLDHFINIKIFVALL